MPVKATIARAEVEHVAAIAERVRTADKAEIYAACGLPPYEALVRSWAVSDHSWTGFLDGVPAAMFGVTQASLVTGTGKPWLIGTDLLDKSPLTFLKECRPFMPEIERRYARLENYVDARNSRAIRWLKWLGFEMGQAEPYGFQKLPFIRFYKERSWALN